VGFVEEATYQRRLPVVDRPAEQKPKQAPPLVRFQVGADVRGYIGGRRSRYKTELGD
jgi:hypothetical protein